MQKVYLSKTMDGTFGIFTSSTLVYSLTEVEYNHYKNNWDSFKKYCENFNFKPTKK